MGRKGLSFSMCAALLSRVVSQICWKATVGVGVRGQSQTDGLEQSRRKSRRKREQDEVGQKGRVWTAEFGQRGMNKSDEIKSDKGADRRRVGNLT